MKQDLYKTEAPAQDPGAVKYRHTLKSGRVVLETYGGHLLVSAPVAEMVGDTVHVPLKPEEAAALGSIARKGGHLPPVTRAAKEYETENVGVSARPEWVVCIAASDSRPRRSLCGRDPGLEFMFINPEHAEREVARGGRLQPCEDCLATLTQKQGDGEAMKVQAARG